MRIILIAFFLGFPFARAGIKQTGLKIDTTFAYHSKVQNFKTSGSFVLVENYKGWTTLIPPKEGIALLGKVANRRADTVELEYIVIDTSKNFAVISTPGIVTRLDSKAEMTVAGDNEEIQVSLLATQVEYETKNEGIEINSKE